MIALINLSSCSLVPFVPNLFSVRVLPGPGGSTDFTVNLGDSFRVEFEVTMGVNVEGREMRLRLLNEPNQFLMDFSDSIEEINFIGAEETALFVYAADTFDFDPPGDFVITAEICGEINEVGTGEFASVDDCQRVIFSVSVVDPDNPSGNGKTDGGEDTGNGTMGPDSSDTATCPQFVEHYNSLPCTTEILEIETTCSDSISQKCTGEEAFNACRIENTFCNDDGQLVQNVDACFALLDCS